MAIVIALVACAGCMEVALFAAGILGPWLETHMIAPWFVPACNVFVFGSLGIVGLCRRKTAAEEDERLTPLLRRDPRTGLRQL